MNADKSFEPARHSETNWLRIVLRVPSGLPRSVLKWGSVCPGWLLPGVLVAILWLAGLGIIRTQNRRFSLQLQEAVQGLRLANEPRLLSMLYEARRENESGAVLATAHVRTRSAAVVAFVQLRRTNTPTTGSSTKRAAKLVNLQELDLPGAQLAGTDLQGVDFSGANLRSSDLRGAHLSASNFSKANLEAVRFRNAQANRVRMEQANLRGADFRAAHLQGAEFFQSTLPEVTIKFGRCADASFREAQLRGANLEEADCRRANLVAADLRDASFRYSKLVGANLSDADLRGANFQLADLSGAQLRGANLEAVDFRRSAGLTLAQVRLAKNWRLALFRETDWVVQEAP